MTSDQVLMDEATAPDAVASPTETQSKPVRRRTTKKAETVEQPALPEIAGLTPAKASTQADGAEEGTPQAAPEKPKRTRTRAVKPTASESTAPTTEAASTPVVVPASETGAQKDAPVRPSIPARFPSRFKRAQESRAAAPEVPIVEAQAATVEAPVEFAPPRTAVEAPRAEVEGVTSTSLSLAESPQPESPRAQDQSAAPTTIDQPATTEQNGAFFPDNAAGENGSGEMNGPNGELPEGFGRMRYRERREFRRQQRMQQRQDRLGPNGEVIPFQDNRAQDGRVQDGRPQDGRVQPSGNGQNGFNRGQNGFSAYPPQERQAPQRRREYDFFSLKNMGDEDLENAAREYGLEPDDSRGRDALVMALMEAQARTQNSVLKTGVLDAHDHNKAFLRCEGYTPSEQDVYVSQTQIKRFNLKTGDLVFGTARAPKENERFFGLLRVESINDLSPEELRFRKDFEKLTPIFPDERYHLETEQTNITARIIDLVSPVGKGQRGLIVAPPKAGKTTLIKSIANSITLNNPEADLFVLLIDERPEEVTDISRSVRGTVVASTFDEMPDNHMRVADIVLERAKRLVEMKRDVVILLDSITRLSRASNLVVTPSGRTLSGGLDPAAMYRPKRMFGAARNIEEGGSLTILATALVDTGSRMDEMIFEEFKGTGNMDLVLDRDLFNQRIFPAIDINKSGTRRDDLLLSKDELGAVFHLRQTLARLDNDQAVKLLIDRLKNTRSNANFMEVVSKSARQAEIKNA